MDYLPLPLQSLYPVGRLDLQSEGMLLMTNDGDFANRVLHPRYEIQKTYWVMVESIPTPQTRESLVTRIPLEDGDGKFDVLKSIPTEPFYEQGERKEGGMTSAFEVVVSEGRNRFIRRSFEFFGHRVIRLKRVRIGGLDLPPGLSAGAFETLDESQLARIFK
jgi:pseudouridine synthase